jgi:ATP-dependent Clp protease protease subunit
LPSLLLALAGPARADNLKPAIAPHPPGAPLPPPLVEPLRPSEMTPALLELRRQQEQLSIENTIADQQLRKDLAKLTAEKQRIELSNAVAQQRLQAEVAAMQADIDRLTKQADLVNRRVALKEAERKAKLDGELADAREKAERLRAANDLATAELAARTRDMTQREQEMRVRTAQLTLQRAELESQIARLNGELDLREKKDAWQHRVQADVPYAKEPFKNGVLTVSDRRIALNGPITMQTADRITERIDYFNNLNREYPIFIVIDSSPGGSVMAGYRILKSMQSSPAPVYVVVKSFAASMAAGITTLAKRSFAYPNAILLHHQLSSGTFGNVTETREHLKEVEEWWRRLAAPVAQKMGISLDEFIKRMYQNRSTGDWREFADAARKIKWVDDVAELVREESYTKNPDAPLHVTPNIVIPLRQAEADPLAEQVDPSGHRYVALPRLDPVDCYYLYNPDHYFRVEP